MTATVSRYPVRATKSIVSSTSSSTLAKRPGAGDEVSYPFAGNVKCGTGSPCERLLHSHIIFGFLARGRNLRNEELADGPGG